jgi:hypothetical protein
MVVCHPALAGACGVPASAGSGAMAHAHYRTIFHIPGPMFLRHTRRLGASQTYVYTRKAPISEQAIPVPYRARRGSQEFSRIHEVAPEFRLKDYQATRLDPKCSMGSNHQTIAVKLKAPS